MMGMQWKLALAFLAGATSLGCDTGAPFGPPLTALAGDFEADRLEFISVADESLSEDLIDAGGEFVLELADDGAFTSTFRGVDGTVVTRSGRFDFVNGSLVFSDDPFLQDDVVEPARFGAARSQIGLSLTDETAEFDFDGDGVLDEARLDVGLLEVF